MAEMARGRGAVRRGPVRLRRASSGRLRCELRLPGSAARGFSSGSSARIDVSAPADARRRAMPARILARASVDRRPDPTHPCPATPASTTRSSCCPPTSGAPSSRSGTSAVPWTTRWTRLRRGRRRTRRARAVGWWRREVGRVLRAAARPKRAQGRALVPLIRGSSCRGAVRRDRRRRRDGPRRPPLRDVRGAQRVLPRVASAVGLICLKIFGYARSGGAAICHRPRGRAAADQHPA